MCILDMGPFVRGDLRAIVVDAERARLLRRVGARRESRGELEARELERRVPDRHDQAIAPPRLVARRRSFERQRAAGLVELAVHVAGETRRLAEPAGVRERWLIAHPSRSVRLER